MTAREILIAAKQELLARGWTQGTAEDPVTGEVCVHGAIGVALRERHSDGLFTAAVSAARDYVSRATGAQLIALWNDDPARTPEEVLAAFDRAIALAAAETREAVTA